MLRLIALALLAASACTGSPPVIVDDTSADADADADSDADADADADTDAPWQPSGTDADSDGFYAEYGDCDDNDIWVNPAWTEQGSRATDGKDNDCDGRIDEKYDGVVLLRTDTSGATPSTLVHIDGFGELVAEVPLSMPVFADWSEENLDRDGWIMFDAGQGMLFDVKESGATSLVFDFNSVDFGEDIPPAIVGVSTHPKGYYLVSGFDRLFKITPDGQMEVIATWLCLEEDMSHELAPVGIATSRFTGETALYGYYGGMGFWREETGFELEAPGDPAGPPFQMWDGHTTRLDGHFALGADASTGEMGVFRWNRNQKTYVLKGPIPDADFTPAAFAIDDESGDFYFTSNPGQWRTVWRIVADGTYASQLYPGGADPLSWPASATLDYGAVGTRWEEAE